jgi:23S rRNA (guanosine2251-2'-O)-methyltransferase
MKKAKEQIIPGFHAIREALGRGRPKIREIWIRRGKKGPRTREILLLAGEKGVPVAYRSAAELDRVLPGTRNQGIMGMAEPFAYQCVRDIIRVSRRGNGLVVVADHITDEGNLGALIRSAAFFGAHGMVLPKDRSARVTERVMKRSAGACAYVPVAMEVNIGRALDTLSKEGFWIIGAAGDGEETLYGFDWKRDLALVLGSEDRGLSRSARERCHQLVRIPRPGQVDSLNVSVACGIFLAEINRQRDFT